MSVGLRLWAIIRGDTGWDFLVVVGFFFSFSLYFGGVSLGCFLVLDYLI